MPELVEGGPIIPVELMNLLDDGRVVFFCGAGISMGTGLPSFKGLVDHVYKRAHLDPDAAERDALDYEEPDEERRHPKLDKVLSLLERDHRLGAADPSSSSRLRRIVVERLSRSSRTPLKMHRALVDLSRTTSGVRLVTTNFDNRFLAAGLRVSLIDTCPRLPVPKRHDWHSLVHLHGRIIRGDSGRNLILTAADFGRAYLTERWAARFITELFREFTVVFLGYSLDDPVMAYMVDALAAERARGAQFGKAFSLAGHKDDTSHRQRVIDAWHAKNVEPIPYNQRNHHRLLDETLVEWARLKKNPLEARTQIALQGINKFPNTSTDPVAARVSWALEDTAVARALAESAAVRDQAEFAKLPAWLDVFAEAGLLARPAPPSHREQAPTLVDGGGTTQQPPRVGPSSAYIAAWIARHLHVPQVLNWVVRKGGSLHPILRDQLEHSLVKPEVDVHPRLRFLWTLLVYRQSEERNDLWLSEQYKVAKSDAERRLLAIRAVDSIAPRLTVKPGPAPHIAFRRLFEKKPVDASAIEECAHVELTTGDPDLAHRIDKVIEKPEVLREHAEALTGHLHSALKLFVVGEERDHASHSYRPSIAPHEQNKHRDDWAELIDWVRDSYFEVAKTDRARADVLLSGWANSGDVLFRRLTLNALTEDTKADIHLIRKVLLQGRRLGLWNPELRRETLRFLRKAGARIPRDLLAMLKKAIKVGPKVGWERQRRDWLSRREVGLRYYKLRESGVRLNGRAGAIADEFAPDSAESPGHRDEFLSWVGEARWVGREERASSQIIQAPFREIATKMKLEELEPEVLEGLALQQPVKCVSALRFLGSEGTWPPVFWQRFLWAVRGLHQQSKLSQRLERFVASVLVQAPSSVFSEVGAAAADFVAESAKRYSADCEPLIATLWNRAWAGIGEQPKPESDDVLTQALNHAAGKLAEAALSRLWKHAPKARSGLPEPVKGYFDQIASDANGHLGRVMLASRLYQLHAIDPDWTARSLISRLEPVDGAEATDLWSAYSWSPVVGPDLLAAIRQPFLEVLSSHQLAKRREGNLVALFISICLDAPSTLTEKEKRTVIDTFADGDLLVITNQIRERLRAAGEKSGEIWHRELGPWLQKFWPSSLGKNTAKTSEGIIRMLLETGTAFPEAVTWAINFIGPTNHQSLYVLDRSGITQQYPQDVLKLLRRLIPNSEIPGWDKATLKKILDAIQAKRGRLSSRADFRSLYHIATH